MFLGVHINIITGLLRESHWIMHMASFIQCSRALENRAGSEFRFPDHMPDQCWHFGGPLPQTTAPPTTHTLILISFFRIPQSLERGEEKRLRYVKNLSVCTLLLIASPFALGYLTHVKCCRNCSVPNCSSG